MPPAEPAEPVKRAILKRPVTIAIISMVAVVALAAFIIFPLILTAQGDAGSTTVATKLPEEPKGTATDFEKQQPNWQSCGTGMQCADVYAPLDWKDPSGEKITLHMVKQPAKNGKPIGSLFVNPGGPGASGADFVLDSVNSAVEPAVQQQYDVIGWDPRGVGKSTPVTCLDAAGMDKYLFGVSPADGLTEGSDEWIAAAEKESADFGAACAKSSGALLGHVSTASTVQDLNMMRAIVGDPKLNYLGYSYGTYIGARFADAYPDKVGRLVLDGAMDPTTSLGEVVREQTLGFEQALRAYVTDCLKRSNCPLSGSVDEAMASIGSLLDGVDAKPLKGSDGRMFTSGTMLTAIITPLYSQSNWPYLDQLFTSVADGNADVGLSLADFYYDRENGKYTSNSTEAFSAINCLDYPSDIDADRMRKEAAELAKIAPTIGRFQGYGDLGCAGWPYTGTERTAVKAKGADPILVVGTTGDPATPYRWAESLTKQLDSGVLLTYEGEGHTAYGSNACVNDAVDAYLLKGTVPPEGTRCK
ncbi:alpha/beta hydrolase [Leucobacter viscericola]|uniref:Alpha/beta hydrolase n=2 Tax=Leucobacter viscericola TaxID=2714935 RepID=A0A6G7XJS9_9MICO|nr:alpha/beta hydrolase [Leucobacter viscericola]